MAFVATVLTACGIETLERSSDSNSSFVATVLTACGIETGNISNIETGSGLQQYLPLAVLKRQKQFFVSFKVDFVATVLTVYGIETHKDRKLSFLLYSTYRLRY